MTFIHNSKLEKTLALLVPSVVLLNYLGRGLYNIALGISLFIVLIFMYKNQDVLKTIYKQKMLLYFSIFTLAVSSTIPFSDNFIFSFDKYMTFIYSSYAALLCSIYLYFYSDEKRRNFTIALYILFATSIIMEIITIFNILSGMDLLHFIKTSEIRPQSSSYHLREIFTSAIIPFNLYFYYQRPSKLKAFFIIISFIGILSSTSRTAMLATLFSLLIFILFKNRGKIFSKDLLMFLAALTISLSLSITISHEITNRIKSFTTTFTSQGDQMSGRFQLYEASFDYYLKSPILGHGVKSSTYYSRSGIFPSVGEHPHNIWLEILMDTGTVGMIGFLAFIFFILSTLIKSRLKQSNLTQATAWGAMASVFMSSLASWSIWAGNHIGPIMFITALSVSMSLFAHLYNNGRRVN